MLIQELRDNGWNKLKADVLSFCAKHGVQTPHFSDLYVDFINSRAEDETTVEHHSAVTFSWLLLISKHKS